jgi:ketosteroid isomerase-like protein
MYSDDAVLLPPDAAIIRGREAIQGFWRNEAEQTTDLKVTVIDVKSLGSANAHAIFRSTVRQKGQASPEVPGKGITLLQKSGEEWKIVAQVWNRDPLSRVICALLGCASYASRGMRYFAGFTHSVKRC